MTTPAGNFDALQVNLANIRTPRIDEYFGVWAIEEMRFCGAFERVSQMNLQVHVATTEKPKLQPTVLFTPASAVTQQRAAGQNFETPTIAVISVSGTLMKQVGSLEDGSSTVALRRDVRTAANTDAVVGIVLLVDSPGGTVAGTQELAAEVEAAAKKKPVYAVVEDLAASAAYWVASGATKIYATQPTALVGSIGTYAGIYDMSGMAAQKGIKAKLYKTGPLKGAGFPGTEITAEQDAHYQALVNSIQEHFSGAVKANRKLTDEQIKAVTTGGVFLAAEAQKLGLIDGIKSFDEALSAIEAEGMKKRKSSGSGAARADAEAPAVTQEEVAMSEPTNPSTTAQGAAPAASPKAATLQELKAALPKAGSDFLLASIEKGETLAQAQARYIAEADSRIEQLQANTKPSGTKPLATPGKPASADGAGDPVAAFKSIVDGHIASGMTRAKAFSKAVHENPEAHKAYIESYNLKHRPGH